MKTKTKRIVFFFEDRLQQQTETSQRTIQILEQNLRIAQHDYEIVRKDL